MTIEEEIDTLKLDYEKTEEAWERLQDYLHKKELECENCMDKTRGDDAWIDKKRGIVICKPCLLAFEPRYARTYGWDYLCILHDKESEYTLRKREEELRNPIIRDEISG